MIEILHRWFWSNRIDALLAQEAPADQRSSMRRHISSCASCRAAYEERLLAERALARLLGDDARDDRDQALPPTRLEQRRAASWLVDELDVGEVDRGLDRAWAPAWAAVAALFLVGIAVPLWLKQPEPLGTVTARGSLVEQAENRWVGVRAFRARGAGEIVELHSNDRELGNGTVQIGDDLVLTVTNLTDEPRYVLVFGIDSQTVRTVAPAGAQPSSMLVAPGTTDQPAHPAFRLTGELQPGWWRLFAIFSAEPFAPDAINSIRQAVAKVQGDLDRPHRLPLGEGFLQDTVLLRIGGSQ